MSENKKSYNPFSSIGRHNINVFVYRYKKMILGFLVLLALLVIGIMFFIWVEGGHKTISFSKISPTENTNIYGLTPEETRLYNVPS